MNDQSNEKERQLFNDYKTFVFRTALLLTNSTALADDVVQETFLRIFQKYTAYDPAKPIKPWILQPLMDGSLRIKGKLLMLSFLKGMGEYGI